MRQLKGFMKEGEEGLICKLHKSLYGLKQSGRVWHNTLKNQMELLGFTTGTADSSIFFKYDGKRVVALTGWSVDDGLFAADSKETMSNLMGDICKKFIIQDLGKPTHLLGIKINRDRDTGTIKLSQAAYITKISNRFNTGSGKSITTPMKSDADLFHSTNSDDIVDVPYALVIGSVNYCSVSTCLDITFSVNKCAQFTSNPTIEHWQAAQRII